MKIICPACNETMTMKKRGVTFRVSSYDHNDCGSHFSFEKEGTGYEFRFDKYLIFGRKTEGSSHTSLSDFVSNTRKTWRFSYYPVKEHSQYGYENLVKKLLMLRDFK